MIQQHVKSALPAKSIKNEFRPVDELSVCWPDRENQSGARAAASLWKERKQRLFKI